MLGRLGRRLLIEMALKPRVISKQSKGYGFDFSNYLGKELFLFDAQLRKGNIKSGYILILFDAEKVVGAWRDESNENNDVNELLNSGTIIMNHP